MLLHPLLAAAATAAVSSPFVVSPPRRQVPASLGRRRRHGPGGGGGVAVRCAANGVGGGGGVTAAGGDTKSKLQVGSPIVIVEAPLMLKTAASVPSLRHNDGQVKAGDVGRILARKPKDVWVVRLAVGSYLLDGKFFSPLDSDSGDDAETQAALDE